MPTNAPNGLVNSYVVGVGKAAKAKGAKKAAPVVVEAKPDVPAETPADKAT